MKTLKTTIEEFVDTSIQRLTPKGKRMVQRIHSDVSSALGKTLEMPKIYSMGYTNYGTSQTEVLRINNQGIILVRKRIEELNDPVYHEYKEIVPDLTPKLLFSNLIYRAYAKLLGENPEIFPDINKQELFFPLKSALTTGFEHWFADHFNPVSLLIIDTSDTISLYPEQTDRSYRRFSKQESEKGFRESWENRYKIAKSLTRGLSKKYLDTEFRCDCATPCDICKCR